jgi:4,4'-diaponeurosporenoate glycosyltransferase
MLLFTGIAIFFIIAWFCGYYILGLSSICSKNLIPQKVPRVTMIIPARNEEHNLANLFKSLEQEEWNPYEIIVVNDHSTDDTERLARSLGAIVVNAKPLPSGWTGKTWACHQGAEVARGDILFFIDADCFFVSGGYSRILNNFNELNSESPTALSILPWHKIKLPFENLSIFFNLILAAGTGSFSLTGKRRLVGQSLIVKKSDYFASGGHESVKDQVLENFFMTDSFLKKGITTATLSGCETLSIRMFPTNIGDLIEGWTKAFSRGAKYTDPVILGASVLWLMGFATVFTIILFPSVWSSPEILNLLLVAYIAFAVQLYTMATKFGSFSWWASACYPFTWLFYQYVFAKSALSKRSNKTWKGRTL